MVSATILSAVNKDQSNYIFLSLQAQKFVYTFFMSSGADDRPEHAYKAELDASGIYDGQWHNVRRQKANECIHFVLLNYLIGDAVQDFERGLISD